MSADRAGIASRGLFTSWLGRGQGGQIGTDGADKSPKRVEPRVDSLFFILGFVLFSINKVAMLTAGTDTGEILTQILQ